MKTFEEFFSDQKEVCEMTHGVTEHQYKQIQLDAIEATWNDAISKFETIHKDYSDLGMPEKIDALGYVLYVSEQARDEALEKVKSGK